MPSPKFRRPTPPSRNQKQRRLVSESLERRELLAAQLGSDSPLAPDPVVEAAFHRAADLTQYTRQQLETADGWTIDPSADSAAFLDSLGSTDELYGYVIWNPTEGQDAISILQDAQDNGQIDGFYPLVNRQQNKRFIPNDPLFANQWHLQNTGQSGGVAGVDANVVPAWDSYTGDGVLIGIVDDGLQHAHPDLDDRYSAADSFDFNDDDADPAPSAADPHGTAVAGVAAAVFENSLGVAGSAPEAGLAGLRLIAGPVSDQDEANALTFSLQNIDIYNNSWGPFDNGTLGAPGPLTLQALRDGIANGRGGLGTIHTWAAGNGLESNDNTNYDQYANSRYTIAVAAVNHDGQQSYYSEPGAPILVTAPSNGDGVGVVTADLLGNQGYNNSSGFSNDYTDSFGGTSSATPLVSGVIALMLEANPNLTWRDVQHILVETSVQNDATDSDWTTNGAGHLVNHKYGFGMVDATAAVRASETWRTVFPEISYDSGPLAVGLSIPDNDSAGVSATHTVTDDVIIESVEVIFDATHTYRGNLEVVLVSPSGTESILSEEHTDPGDDFSSWTFTSMRHWDESSLGDWTLIVRDLASQNVGTFDDWQLRIHGSDGIPSLSVEVSPTTISENGGAAMATITRQFHDLSLPLDVTLASSDLTELVVGSDVVSFGVDVESVTVPVTAVDDDLLDGSQFVTLTATAPGLIEGAATVEVSDFETLALELSAINLFENGDTVELTIRRVDPSAEAMVTLSSSRSDKLTFNPETVTMPVGVSETTVTLVGVDNDIIDGSTPVQVTVSSQGYLDATTDVQVLDFEPLTFTVDETEISESGGVANVVLTRPDTSIPLTVQLEVTPAGVVTSPTVIEFEVGEAQASFTLDAIDNSVVDGLRQVAVTATAPEHVEDAFDLTVLDHEELDFVLPVNSVFENDGVIQARLVRSDPTGETFASLSSTSPFRVQVPPSVAFSDGERLSEPFDVTLRDNTVVDGDVTVSLTAFMFGFELGLTELEVRDFEPLELTRLGGVVSEDAGEVSFLLTRPSPAADAEIFLAGGQSNVFELPESVMFESGATEVTFVGTLIDDEVVLDDAQITVIASSDVYIADSTSFTILEDDVPELTLELDMDELVEGAGPVSARLLRNTRTELTVSVTSSIPGVLDLPTALVVPAGRGFVDFEIDTINDSVASGNRQVDLTVSGSGHPVLTKPVTVADDEIPGFEFSADSLQLEETGSAFVGLNLLAQPDREVVVSLSASDANQLTITPAELVFSPSNWNLPQSVRVAPVNDQTVEDTQVTDVIASVVSDGPYATLEDLVLPVEVEDDDVPMILLEETESTTIVNEFGLVDTVLLSLGARPQSDVQIVLDGTELPDVEFAPSTLTFTPDNWDQQSVITISTPLDFEIDGNRIGKVYVDVDPEQSDAAYASAGQRIFAVIDGDSVLDDLVVRQDSDQLLLLDNESGQILATTPIGGPDPANFAFGPRSEQVVVEPVVSDGEFVVNTLGGDDNLVLEAMVGGLFDGGEGFDVVSLVADGELPAESAGGVKLRNIEELDLSSANQQIVQLDPQRVEAITDEGNTLTLTIGPEDVFSLSSTWTIGAPTQLDGVPTHSLTNNGMTIQLANGAIWQNPVDRFDVDRSGGVSPSDALALINRLAVQESSTLPFFPSTVDELYFDVNGDGETTVRDPLAIINRLAAVTNQSPLEGEATDLLRSEDSHIETPVDQSVSTLGEEELGKACEWHSEAVDQAVDEITQSDWLSDGETDEESESVFGPIWNPLA